MTIYNFTNLTDSNTTLGILQYANQITDNMYGVMIVIGFFAIILISSLLKGQALKDAFAAGAFSTFLIALLLKVMDLIHDEVLFMCLLLVIIGVLVLVWKRGY